VKETLSTTTIFLTLAAFIPYIVSVLKGAVRPHVFSWVIWGITTVVVFLAQVEAKGGVGRGRIWVSVRCFRYSHR
jgi:hypothetical protein